MTLREGAKVSFVGYPDERGLAIGDQGLVVANAGSASHVRWLTGACRDQMLLVREDEVVQATASREPVDFAGPLVTFAVRDVYDAGGEVGLLNALADDGHLAGFTQIAEEALGSVQSRIAADPSIAEVLGQLEEPERTEVLSFMAVALLRDAFGREE